MSRFKKYNELRFLAEEECKVGGDPEKGLVFAVLALAEARIVTETDKLELSGHLVVDS